MLTQEYLKECVDYNRDTGIFIWLHRPECHFKNKRSFKQRNAARTGKQTGSFDGKGYYTISIDNKSYLSHRLAWLYEYGKFPENDIDHVDGNRLNNRISNLREATRLQNMQNQRAPRGNNKTTNLLGVSLIPSSGKFRARVTVAGKTLFSGCYKTKEEAAIAYTDAKRRFHPFGNL